MTSPVGSLQTAKPLLAKHPIVSQACRHNLEHCCKDNLQEIERTPLPPYLMNIIYSLFPFLVGIEFNGMIVLLPKLVIGIIAIVFTGSFKQPQ